MRTGRPKTPLSLTEDERHQLTSLAHRSRTAAASVDTQIRPLIDT